MPNPQDPSGQKPSNPFIWTPGQPTEMKADAIVDTSSAKVAFKDLEQLFKQMMKSMGNDWDNVTNESLKKQEKLYNAIGDKQNAHRAMVIRLKNEAVAAIEEEKDKKLAALDMQIRAEQDNANKVKQLEQEKLAISTKVESEKADIEKKTVRELSRETGLGGLIRGKTANAGAMIGGPMGGLISGAGEMLANPYALGAMALFEMFKTKAAFTKTGAELAGAGFGLGSGAGVGLNFATKLFSPTMAGPFGRLGQALSQGEQQAIIGQMATSRTMIEQTKGTGGFEEVRNNLGLFANILPDAAKDMEIMTDATKNLGMTQKDITNTFVSSRVNAEQLKITQLDAIKTQMDMAKALRNLTNDGAVAASTLSNITDYLNSIGANEAEKQRIGVSVAQAGANLTLPQMAGMLSFTKGINPMSKDMEKSLFGENGRGGILGKEGTGPFQLLGSFLTKVGDQFKNNPMAKIFAADQLRQQYLPGLRLQDTPQFFQLTADLQKGGMSQEEYARRFADLEKKTPQVAMVEGLKTLSEIVDPIKRIENVFSNFWTMVDDKINHIFQMLGKASPFNIFKGIGSTKNIARSTGVSAHMSDTTGSPTSEGRYQDSKGNWHTPH